MDGTEAAIPVNHDVKTALKKSLLPGSTLFEDMGFTYLGPVDGHDVDRLVQVLAWAKDLHVPGAGPCEDREGQGLLPRGAESRPSSTASGHFESGDRQPCARRAAERLLLRVRQRR